MVLTAAAPLVSRITWQANGESHTLLEVVATQLALTTGAIALVRYYAKRNRMFLLIGVGFLGAGHTPSALSALTHWSGAVSLVFLSFLLVASLLPWKKRPKAGRSAERLVHIVGST